MKEIKHWLPECISWEWKVLQSLADDLRKANRVKGRRCRVYEKDLGTHLEITMPSAHITIIIWNGQSTLRIDQYLRGPDPEGRNRRRPLTDKTASVR